jgi:hypothetical protein
MRGDLLVDIKGSLFYDCRFLSLDYLERTVYIFIFFAVPKADVRPLDV